MQVRISIVRESKPPPAPASGRSRGWRRPAGLAVVMAVIATALVASAGAAPTTDTTAVAFVPVSAKKVMSANSIPAGATESAIVIGGTTTVPSNATTVRLVVTVKGAAAGTITLFPAGNEAGGAGHTVSWAAGATTTETEAENVGLSNKVSVKNSSTKAAVVTLTITGYSTQVTAGDINGSGGTNGQVLTNNGAEGATWRSLDASNISGLQKNDGFGFGYGASVFFNATTVVATLAVPAGNYLVQFSGEFENRASTVNTATCTLVSPAGNTLTRTRETAAGIYQSGSAALVGLGKTTGGSFKVWCASLQGQPGVLYDASLVAVQLDNISGVFTPANQSSRSRD